MTEVAYSRDKKHAAVDGFTFTRDEKSGYYLATKPTCGNKRERLHNYMWRPRVGEVQKGFHVHHVNGDKCNNEVSNLAVVSASEHARRHASNMSEERRAKLRENIAVAQEAAKEWHRSEKGREWHRMHAVSLRNKKVREKVCENCGKAFETKEDRQRFCSNACKSAWRRKEGVDDEKRTCERCGAVFAANKYSKRRFCCKGCASKAHGRSQTRLQSDSR